MGERPGSVFSKWKRGVFRRDQEIKGWRGGVHRYAAQASPPIDAVTAEKNRFPSKTKKDPGSRREPSGAKEEARVRASRRFLVTTIPQPDLEVK
jgi:hypothetical protein